MFLTDFDGVLIQLSLWKICEGLRSTQSEVEL